MVVVTFYVAVFAQQSFKWVFLRNYYNLASKVLCGRFYAVRINLGKNCDSHFVQNGVDLFYTSRYVVTSTNLTHSKSGFFFFSRFCSSSLTATMQTTSVSWSSLVWRRKNAHLSDWLHWRRKWPNTSHKVMICLLRRSRSSVKVSWTAKWR